jgi:effector-binding domain-containing protein
MSYQVDLMERPSDKVLSVPVSTPAGEVGAAIGSAIERLFTRAAEAGLQPSGPPEVTYLSEFVPDSDIPARIEVDLPVTGPVDSVAEARQRAACQVARTVHRGAYDSIGKAHQALAEWAGAKGYRPGGPPTEVYLVGPDVDREPSSYLTEIVLPLTR